MSNTALLQCECGCAKFEVVKEVSVTKFFDGEYKKGEGFTERIPTFFTECLKLRCINCSKFYKD